MSTVSTNVMKTATSALFEIACLFVSIGALTAAGVAFMDDVNPFNVSMLALYAFGVIAALGVVKSPVTVLGEIYAGVFKVVGGLFYVLGAFMSIPWMIGIFFILGNHGLGHEHALAILLWVPVYFGLPALVGLSGNRH